MGVFEIIMHTMAVLGFLMLVVVIYLAQKKTLTLADIRQEIRDEKICAKFLEKHREEDAYIYRFFLIHTVSLKCTYGIREGLRSEIKNQRYERLQITIDGMRGLLNATFCNDELVAWNIQPADQLLQTNDPSIIFALKDILGAVQNAAGLIPGR